MPPVAIGSSSSYLPSTCPWEISPATGRGGGAWGAVFNLDLEIFTDSGPWLKGSAASFLSVVRRCYAAGFGPRLCLYCGSSTPFGQRAPAEPRKLSREPSL